MGLAALVGGWGESGQSPHLLGIAKLAPGEELEPPGPGSPEADALEGIEGPDLVEAPVRLVVRSISSFFLELLPCAD